MGIQQLRRHNFALFWPPTYTCVPNRQFLYECGQKRHFWTTYPPDLVDIVIEWPLRGNNWALWQHWDLKYEPTSTLSFWEDQQFKTKSPFPEHSGRYGIKLSKKFAAFLLTLLLELVQNNLNCSKMVWIEEQTQLGFESWIWAGTNGLVSGRLACTSSKNLKT